LKKLTLITILILSISTLKSQVIKEWGIGAELAYNIPISEIGFGIRSHLHFTDRIVVAPQIAYFPGFTNINEFYFGANLHFNFTPETKWGVYGIAGPHYNRWMNWENSTLDKAQLSNFTAELGGGIVKNTGCLRPFLEYRADSKWWESNLRLGLLVYFGDCSGRSKDICPAYTRL
jgi:hypothetical protein